MPSPTSPLLFSRGLEAVKVTELTNEMDEADHAHPEEHFLFTSESVGEGHPGKNYVFIFKTFSFSKREVLYFLTGSWG